MKSINKIGFIALIFSLMIACTANKTATTSTPNNSEINTQNTEKLSIRKKLTENNHQSIEQRIALYHQLKKKNSDKYNFENEEELNRYAYDLVNADLLEEAIEIFKLNVEQFPNSGFAYDNLANAYSRLSNKYRELSKVNREKSLELWRILDMDENWGTEIFHFPIRFAKEINYEGIEDARFSKEWSDTTRNGFWSYLFGWNINLTTVPTEDELENNLKLYYDGLMNSVNRDESIDPKITVVQLRATNPNNHRFIGTVEVFDAFITKKPLVLNIIVDYDYCEAKKTSQILFRISPKSFDNEIWTALESAKFRDEVCEK